MTKTDQITYDDNAPQIAASNEQHLACVLLLDTSASMQNCIEDLNTAVNRFKEDVCKDELSRRRVDVAIVQFGSTVNVVQDFVPVEDMQTVSLETNGNTAMGTAINTAIDMVKERNRLYKSLGTPCFKPWIFMITDGMPCGEPANAIEDARRRIKEEEAKGPVGKLKFFALGVKGYNKDLLTSLTPRAMELSGTNFDGIFNWLSQSMVAISVSTPGCEPPLQNLPEDASRIVTDW